MTIDPISGTGGPGVQVSQLTPEALMIYCSSRLNDLDGEIKGLMDSQQQALKDKAALSQVADKMKEYFDGHWTKHGNHWDDTGATIDAAINSLPKDDPVRGQLQDFKKQLWAASHPNGISLDDWKAWTGKLQTMAEDVKGNSELNMIQLQSLMSQRQTAVNLTTGMLAKYDQTVADIVKNV